ncbi:MAG: hypothetical protein HQ591_13325 [candidate division Zixibacteria bacterium]|nr:hypothetical protein [Candidatus Tariuqbacter arcticus]
MKKLSTYLLAIWLIIFGAGIGFVYAQDVKSDSSKGEAEGKPQEVLKIEEVTIMIPAMQVFTIPRMEAELPPVDFIGIFKSGILQPDPAIFCLREEDLKPVIIDDYEKILAKKRK